MPFLKSVTSSPDRTECTNITTALLLAFQRKMANGTVSWIYSTGQWVDAFEELAYSER
jgi:hypothetical protein